MLFLSAPTPNTSILGAILSSAAVSSIISGIISLMVVGIEKRTTIDINCRSKRLDLLLDLHRNLRTALSDIEDNHKWSPNLRNLESAPIEALTVMYKKCHDIMKMMEQSMDENAYLLSKPTATSLRDKLSDLVATNSNLSDSEIAIRGVSYINPDSPDLIPPERRIEAVMAFTFQTKDLLSEYKDAIEQELRTIFETT